MRWSPWVVLMLILSGCAEPEPETSQEDPETIIDEDRPDESYGDVETGPAVGPDLNATTAAAPELIPGEWWRIRFNGYLGGEDIEVVRVVAAVDEAGYIFGMPHEGWLKEAIAFHSPAFGDVNFDLSYNVHNERFEPVQFPLTQGATWETSFATQAFVAEVTEADEFTATIRFTPDAEAAPTDPMFELMGLAGGDMVLEYDARQHEIVSMESDIGTWEVLEHGYDYEGWVTVPRGEHTAIDVGAFMPASESHDLRERTIDVSDEFNRITMMHFVGSAGDAPGRFEAKTVTPDGEEWITTLQGSGSVIEFYELKDPGGPWTLQDTIAGAGFTYHMGIAYFQYDIRLPDGARRADHSHEVIR